MKISLHLNGRTMSFSEEELLSRLERLSQLEKQFASEEKDVDIVYEEAKKPTEGKYFKIFPNKIDESLFTEQKLHFMQEWTRNTILKALVEVKRKPEKYARPFATFLPKKTWKSKTVAELKAVTNVKGVCISNWVEQSLEWAQRLTNGESWVDICNTPDSSNWYRLVIWKNDQPKIVGGSCMCGDSLPPCTVFGNNSNPNDILRFTVPLLRLYL